MPLPRTTWECCTLDNRNSVSAFLTRWIPECRYALIFHLFLWSYPACCVGMWFWCVIFTSKTEGKKGKPFNKLTLFWLKVFTSSSTLFKKWLLLYVDRLPSKHLLDVAIVSFITVRDGLRLLAVEYISFRFFPRCCLKYQDFYYGSANAVFLLSLIFFVLI